MENNEKENQTKMNLLNKIVFSISKFEKYPEMAALGIRKALLYLAQLILINSIVFTGIYVYYVQNKPIENDENIDFSEKMVNEILANVEFDEEQLDTVSESFREQNNIVLIISFAIGFFISLYITTFIDALTLSAFGILTCLFARIRIKYKALLNMSIYSLTLSIILRTIYMVIIYLTPFKIKYFNVMYIAVSYISLTAAIFIIKSNLIKHQLQLMKIVEENKDTIKETITIDKKEEEKEEQEEKGVEEDKKENKNDESQGESSSAYFEK